MKRKLILIAALMALFYTGYLILMMEFETPIRLDWTNSLRMSPDAREIELPWYCEWLVCSDGKMEGQDENGNHYTDYVYALPSAFESAELHCIVCWEKETAIAFVGDSRAMYVIDLEFPSVFQ